MDRQIIPKSMAVIDEKKNKTQTNKIPKQEISAP